MSLSYVIWFLIFCSLLNYTTCLFMYVVNSIKIPWLYQRIIMFTAFGCTDMTFIFNSYYQSMCPAFNINIQKSERVFRKHKLKTGTYYHMSYFDHSNSKNKYNLNNVFFTQFFKFFSYNNFVVSYFFIVPTIIV